MDSGSEEDIGTGDAGLFEDDLGVNEFAETLELIESNAEEIDAQVLDAITEASLVKFTYHRTTFIIQISLCWHIIDKGIFPYLFLVL